MDSISLRVHTPRNIDGDFGTDRNGDTSPNYDILTALLMNSDSARSLYENKVDWMSYSVPVMANELALLPTDYILKMFHRTDTNTEKEFIKGRFHLPSFHYDIGYRIDLIREFIDISFSIPKYVYGHSVAQFVYNPHVQQRKYSNISMDFDSVTANWYDMFRNVIKDFFKSTFLGVDVNYSYVEVVRIDFAFNQYFRTKEEACRVAELMSLKTSKLIRGKKGRDTYTHDDMSSGFIAVSKNLYYKVYHKGTEFASVGDSKRLTKRNFKYAKESRQFIDSFGLDEYKRFSSNVNRSFNVEELQKEADLILRHEIRFTSRTMSYWFKRKIFREKSSTWQDELALFKRLEKKRIAHIRDWQNSNIPEQLKAPRLNDHEKSLHKKLQAVIQKRHRFFLKVDPVVLDYHSSDSDLPHNYFTEAAFTRKLFNFMVNKFKLIIESMQIKELPTWDTVYLKAVEWNTNADLWNKSIITGTGIKKMSKIPISGLRKAFKAMGDKFSLELLRESNFLSRSTFYEYVKHLENLGFSTTMDSAPVKSDTTFQSYFERLKGIGIEKAKYHVYFSGTIEKYKMNF